VELGTAEDVAWLVVGGTDEGLAVLVPGEEEPVDLLEDCALEPFVWLVALDVSAVPDGEVVEERTAVFEVEDVVCVEFAGGVHLGRT
jgi:hypothetical protein